MRHRVVKHSFGRKTGPRRALLKGLMNSLIEREQMQTTLAKAKEVRRHTEKLVTIAKKNTLHARRLLISRLGSKKSAFRLLNDLGTRFKSRKGGYTRIIKTGRRVGDQAEMALIEFVDYKPKKVEEVLAKDQKKQSKNLQKAKASHKKTIRKIQARSRAMNR